MKYLVVAVLLAMGAGGCASSGAPGSGKDGGGGLSICPDHPDQCGGKCCGAKCVDTSADPFNCGDCNTPCGEGLLCQGGHCGCLPTGAMCGTGQSCCNGVGCKSLMTDANNCGGCGKSCGSGGTCKNGQCSCGNMTCGAAETCCNGTCSTNCATDMGMAVDMSTNSGLCQCSDHCALDLIGWCVGTDCCYVDGLGGSCAIGPCQINQTP